MSARSNPFEEIERFFDRLSHQFEEASETWTPDTPFGRWPSFEPMSVDVVENDADFVVTVDLPGFDRDDVTIEVSDHTLRVEADREERVDEEEPRYLRHERRHESAERSIRLPGDVDKEAVTATMKNGVLTVTLPKTEVEESHTVEIE